MPGSERAWRRWRAFRVASLLGAALALGGCAGGTRPEAAVPPSALEDPMVAVAAGPPPRRSASQVGAEPRRAEMTTDPIVREVAGSALGPPESDAAAGVPSGGQPILFDDPGAPPVLFSQDPELLRAEVAAECLSARAMQLSRRKMLDAMVTGLYLSVIDPAEATEALILGNCAPVGEIVREMVIKGGEPVRTAVSDRAVVLSPPQAHALIAKEARNGIVRHLELGGGGSGPTRLARNHAMAYFPSSGAARRVPSSAGMENLYRRALPGFGVYTFVLIGGRVERLPEPDQARHRELFRLVETYAAADGEPGAPPRSDAHVFLIPVDQELATMPLFHQVAADLSDGMRRDLMEALAARGEAALAERLRKGAGPFLVAGPNPSLLPGRAGSYRLIADLSGLGIEYLYAVVDAFDRDVAPGQEGRPEGLEAIRDRLRSIGTAPPPDGSATGGPQPEWFFLIAGTLDGDTAEVVGRWMIEIAALFKGKPPSA